MLTLTYLKLAMRDLLDKRRPDLLKSKAGKYHEAALQEHLETIDALPSALTGGVPLAGLLDALDTEHDGYGGAIYFVTEVYLRLPGADEAIVAAAQRIRAAFIPSLSELGAAYALEAERALERRPLLTSMKADLKRFPLAGGDTLLDVATAFLDAGVNIHQALSERADLPRPVRKEAAKLRSATIGTLGRLRADLKRELKKDPKLPQDLETRIFGYFDTLENMRAAAKASADDAPVSEDLPDTKRQG